MSTFENSSCFERSTADQAYDLLGQMIAEQETEQLLLQLEEDRQQGNTAEMDAFFARQEEKHLKLIKRSFRKEQRRIFLTQTLGKVLQTAAILIVVIAVVGGAAVAGSHMLRVKVMEFVMETTAEWTVIDFDENPDLSYEVPAEWLGTSYPSKLPEGLEIAKLGCYPNSNVVDYRNVETKEVVLTFCESGPGSSSNIDTEDATIVPVTIQGGKGILIIKDDFYQYKVCWQVADRLFKLFCHGFSQEEVLSIAESVVPIEK